jgi:hypothetical protein
LNISVECPSDFGANLVQHFIGRYSRYQTVLLKLEEIIIRLGLFQYTKSSATAGLFVRLIRCLGRTENRPILFTLGEFCDTINEQNIKTEIHHYG